LTKSTYNIVSPKKYVPTYIIRLMANEAVKDLYIMCPQQCTHFAYITSYRPTTKILQNVIFLFEYIIINLYQTNNIIIFFSLNILLIPNSVVS